MNIQLIHQTLYNPPYSLETNCSGLMSIHCIWSIYDGMVIRDLDPYEHPSIKTTLNSLYVFTLAGHQVAMEEGSAQASSDQNINY